MLNFSRGWRLELYGVCRVSLGFFLPSFGCRFETERKTDTCRKRDCKRISGPGVNTGYVPGRILQPPGPRYARGPPTMRLTAGPGQDRVHVGVPVLVDSGAEQHGIDQHVYGQEDEVHIVVAHVRQRQLVRPERGELAVHRGRRLFGLGWHQPAVDAENRARFTFRTTIGLG